jgi:hypothetical protein
MVTTSKDIGRYLEQQAKLGEPVTYGQVIRKFPDLPELTGNWKAHPLCWMFGDLDDEDTRNGLPFRTALVFAKETGKPGNGFFETIKNHRKIAVLKSDEEAVWVKELNALKAHYQPSGS